MLRGRHGEGFAGQGAPGFRATPGELGAPSVRFDGNYKVFVRTGL